jgi:DNA/RNA-binding domain of Phe-tRNA-synthetase-like protein
VVEGECEKNEIADEPAFLLLKAEAEKAARAIQPLSAHPNIASWRAAFRKFWADPTKTRSSAESLARRLQKGGEIPRINGIVDIYNCISALHTIPVGGQDAEKISGGVVLRLAAGNDKFTPLGSLSISSIDVGEVVYSDSQKILCSKWNYRDCEDAKISPDTRKFVLFVDGAPGIQKEKVEATSSELAQSLSSTIKGCRASYSLSPPD